MSDRPENQEPPLECPACRGAASLGDDGRAWCAACEVELAVTPTAQGGEGPMRSIVLASAAIPDTPPSGNIRVVRGAGDGRIDEIVISSSVSRKDLRWQLALAVLWIFGAVGSAVRDENVAISAVIAFLCFFQIFRTVRSSVRLTFETEALAITKRGGIFSRVERLPYEAVAKIRIEQGGPLPRRSFRLDRSAPARLAILRKRGEPIYVIEGREGLELPAPTLHWLAAKLTVEKRGRR